MLKNLNEKELLKTLNSASDSLSASRGEPKDRIRKKISFHFLMRRLMGNSPGQYVLKGGYAIEVKFDVIRATKDIDLITKIPNNGDDTHQIGNTLRQRFVDAISDAYDDDDKFIRFKVDDDFGILKGGGGGVQLSVKMMVGNQRFSEFSIDLGLEDIKSTIKTTMKMKAPVDGFSKEMEADVLGSEQMFAEKLHAYMRHGAGFQSRAKDFVDLVFLAKKDFDDAKCKTLIQEVFNYWLNDGEEKGLKSLPNPPKDINDIQPPPSQWTEQYEKMAKEMCIEGDMVLGYRILIDRIDQIFKSK